MKTDEELENAIVRLKNDDWSARAKLYDLTHERIFRFCFFLCQKREESEDLCQDVYVRIFLSIRQLKDSTHAYAWFYKIARNLFLDLRKKKRESHTEDLPESSEVRDNEELSHITSVLKTFSQEDQILLILVDLAEQSYAEAAAIVGLSEAAVRSRIHRIRKEFIKKYSSFETN